MRGAPRIAGLFLFGCFVDSPTGSGDTEAQTGSTAADSSAGPTSSSPTSSTSGTSVASETEATSTSDGTLGTGMQTTTGFSEASTNAELGRFGSAVAWNGGCANESEPSEALVLGGAAFTVEMWLRIDAVTLDDWQMLVYRGGDSDGAPSGWTLELERASALVNQYRLQFCGGAPTSGGFDCVASDQLLELDTNYHVAAVRLPPGTVCNGNMDGCAQVFVASAGDRHTQTIGTVDFDWASAAALAVAGGNPTCNRYPGMVTIDELRIWSAPRTADEIDAAMDDVVMCNMADLVAYFGFDQVTMNAFADCTGVTPMLMASPEYELVDSPFDE